MFLGALVGPFWGPLGALFGLPWWPWSASWGAIFEAIDQKREAPDRGPTPSGGTILVTGVKK
eukprot:7743827-Pyramimonas_sp.AAC.1